MKKKTAFKLVRDEWDEIKSNNGVSHRGVSEAVQSAARDTPSCWRKLGS
jgi:hypothetical protein